MNIDKNDHQYIDFDSEAYYARYLDIARAFYRFQRMERKKEINAKMFAWKHYVLYGRQEGRLAEFKRSHDEKMKKEKEEKEEKKDEFVITSKETFREACMRELPHARSIIIPKAVEKEPHLETVLIEFRWLPHLEFLVRNMVIKLHHWNHTIVCGNNNFREIQTMRDSICPDIRIIHMDIDNLVPSTYNELLMTKPFWKQFHGEKLLIYQEDSFLFHERIEPFLDYDYVGAPWPKHQDDNKLCVGNGGFSLRTKDVMIQVIENVKMESFKLGKNTIDYMKNTNSFVFPEDVYFTKAMIDFKIGWVAPWEIARKFSQEAIPSENPLGGHNFFLGNHEHNNLMIRINTVNKNVRNIDSKINDRKHLAPTNLYQATSASNDVICIFHCGDIETFDYIIRHFPCINKMKLIVSYYESSYHDKLTNYPELNIIHLLSLRNKGCDLGPFLLTIKFLIENAHMYDDNTNFIKLHTKSVKKNKYWTETLIKDIVKTNITRKDIPIIFASNEFVYEQNKEVNPYCRKILTKYHNSDFVSNYFDTYNHEYTSSKENVNNFTDLQPNFNFYQEYEKQPINHWFQHGIHEFHRKSNVNYIKKWASKENYFVAGTIFGFNAIWLQMFKHYDLDYEYSILEEGYVTNHIETNTHSWEYYFGFVTLYNGGEIHGYEDSELQRIYKSNDKDYIPPIFSSIYRPYLEAKIAFFMLVPSEIPDSGGYRTLLNYIKLLNDRGFTVDLYFGMCWNEHEVELNVNQLNKYGIPCCQNWFNYNINHIHVIIENIKKYNVLEIERNNYYIGFKCQRNYDILVANAWQTAEAVFNNKSMSKDLYYIIQDREELFYPNDIKLQKKVLKTYKKEFKYYCITQYLGNYFKELYSFEHICSSYMGVNLNIYKNFKQSRECGAIIPYYKDTKPGRKPNLVRKIVKILSTNNIKCYIYPYDFEDTNNNIVNLSTMTEYQLNELYNKYNVGIIFSNTNPSRLGFEMYASGLNVIEYDSDFTDYDMPNQYFTKIKSEENIVDIVQTLFYKNHNEGFLEKINMDSDYDNFFHYLCDKI